MSKILDELISEFKQREQKGIETYGTTVDRKDLTTFEWLRHLREELMDACLYLKKLENEIPKKLEQNDK